MELNSLLDEVAAGTGSTIEQQRRLERIERDLAGATASIRQKLREAGLEDKLGLLQDFERDNQHRFSTLRSALRGDGVAHPGTLTRRIRRQPAWSAIRSATVAGPLAVRAPAGIEIARRKQLFPRAEQSDEPQPGDLAPSGVVLLTPEIRARAAVSGNSALDLYQYVHDNFELEIYYGPMKNSQAVLWSGGGND